jgi:hypothetical protein
MTQCVLCMSEVLGPWSTTTQNWKVNVQFFILPIISHKTLLKNMVWLPNHLLFQYFRIHVIIHLEDYSKLCDILKFSL